MKKTNEFPGKPYTKRYPLVTAFVTLLLTAVCWAFPGSALTHSLFIQAASYNVKVGKESPLFFCYGHHVPVHDALRSEKLAWIKAVSPDNHIHSIVIREGKSLHSYMVAYDVPGTWTLAAETTPGFYTIYTDKKGREHHAIKPLSAIIDKAAGIKDSLRSSQWTKTYVNCGKASDTSPEIIGMPLELVPHKNPLLLKKGDSLIIQVHSDGKPYTGTGFFDATYNGFSTESEDMYLPRAQASNGKFTVPIDSSGRWFVRFFTKQDAPEKMKREYLTEKKTTTLTFEVRNERRRPRTNS